MKIKLEPNIKINRCMAKTQKNTCCQKTPSKGHFLCKQHDHIYIIFLQRLKTANIIDDYAHNYVTINKGYQTGGQLLGLNILNVLVPSCLDVLSCDWITDITYAIPGLSSLIQLVSY